MRASVIGRVGIEICIETFNNESLTAIWPTQMPFSPDPRALRSELASEDRVKDGEGSL